MPDDLSVLRPTLLAEAVAKLEELMTQSGRAFLVGAGCSKCAGLPLTTELTEEVLQSPLIDTSSKQILQALQSQFAGATDANIEDYLSDLIDLLSIAERRSLRNATKNDIELNGQAYTADQLRGTTEQIKIAIATILDKLIDIKIHWQFIKAVHRPIRPGTSISNKPVDYLILNYDTLIEDALALEKIQFADGLDGGVTGWWNPTTFYQDGLDARVLKLHGSINWCEFPDDALPRRVSKSLCIPAQSNRNVLIWPASTKYRETQRDPFAQLIGIARESLRPKDRTQKVLVVCGYSFGDLHINLELDKALRESSGHLTMIAFTSETQLPRQLKSWHEDRSVSEQVLIFAKRGFYHNDKVVHTDYDLPWWKFENITRILGGER
ncbi:MAG: SIR2 family protein [Proteobacteria bacterium]|nr:SIR2 family protein [Pseudomonadota bacterium]